MKTSKPTTIKGVCEQMEKALLRETKQVVEVTARGKDEWTVSGQPDAVVLAVQWLVGCGLMKHEETIHDDELSESFAFLNSRK